jgi:plasmid stabilization system protein ParE
LKRQVRLVEAARRDLERLEAFLALKSPAAAMRAADAIILAVMSRDELSERGLLDRQSGLRELPVDFGRDGYTIQYRVDPSEVLVARIFHNREAR